MKRRTLWAGMALSMVLITPAFAATETVGITNVEYHTVDEILTLYHLMELDQVVDTTFDVAPDLDTLTTSGALSAETQQNALDTLNFARYIAGLSYDVTINETYAQNAQDATLALAALGGAADHDISQPSGMSDELYASAHIGTTQGNLSAGIDDLSTNVIHGWLSDEGANNFNSMGHRRYALSPSLTETGFGLTYAENSANYDTYTAMRIQSVPYGGDTTGVIWPAQNMPVEYFYSNYPWTFIANSPLAGETTVTITREGDGATWIIKDDFFSGSTGDGVIAINNDNYGQSSCIIFTPDNITYKSGDVYQVEISGSYTASYSVNFFSLSDGYTVQPSVTLPNTEVTEAIPEVEIEETPAADLSNASAWAQTELQEAVNAGFPVAVYADQFQEAMTRGEFAHMLGLFCDNKWPMTYHCTTSFTDLGDDDEVNMYIAELYSWGVINGINATTFDPDATITREAIAKLLLGVKELTLNVTVTQDISHYADASSVSSWALDGVRYMNQIGVLNGTTDNCLNPQGNITVQEAALMCYRLFQ